MVTKFLSLTKLKSQFQSTHILWQTYYSKLKIYMYMYLQREKGAAEGSFLLPKLTYSSLIHVKC